ncbi:proline racemase [Paenibacillus algorifonticola]|uniref:Proline racemase n=1 Tax=Paenibacillus algorifonticola TaxID=684063 RepID=A0A1I2C441_9BACL|nr:proline racemase family protein [Paenibacillus algorifonticola]SFE62350.1 proline racemase [Paenibacillus algorifonticola]
MEINKWYAAIDTHSGGEPLRILTGGLPQMAGASQQAKSLFFKQHHDSVRKLLMAEPRGHYGMTGAIVTAPVSEEALFGLLFLNQEGLAAISGHGIFAVVTAWVATGQLDAAIAAGGISIDCPAGTVNAFASCEGQEVRSVSFHNVPSFVYAESLALSIQDIEILVDVAFSGEFYAVVDAAGLGDRRSIPELQAYGGLIRKAIEAQLEVKHPLLEGITGIHGVFFYEKDESDSVNPVYRSWSIFAGEQLDRSPGGAGACAHMTVLNHKGSLHQGQQVIYEGIAGTRANGSVEEEICAFGYKAVIPKLTGSAYVLGFMNFVLDPSDPLADGFVLY